MEGTHFLRQLFHGSIDIVSHLAQNGVSIVLIKELLGHADIKTTMRYSHLTSLAIKEAVKTLENKSGDNTETILQLEDKKIINLIPVSSKIPQKNQ